jgi:prolyl-tRNA synthetase
MELQQWHKEPIRVEVDQRDLQGGVKSWEWIKKGVPIRVEIGPRDLEAGTVFVGRRDKGPREKQSFKRDEFACLVPELLQSIQDGIYERALAFRREHTKIIESKEEFYAFFTPKNADKPEIHGGFALAHWNGSAEVEAKIKEDLKVTIRCIPFEEMPAPGTCIFTGEKSEQRVIFAKSY